MNKGKFITQVNFAWKILTRFEMSESRNHFPKFPENPAETFRDKRDDEIWAICYQNNYFDFQLYDNSLMHFRAESFRPLQLSYTYYECFYVCYSYEEFLMESNLTFREVQDELKADYEEYLTTCDLKNAVTPIRYDFDCNQYREGIHPASHMHFGPMNQIRIGARKILNPISFVLFIIRQIYPLRWQEFLQWNKAPDACKYVRHALDDIHSDFWNNQDEWEMFLT
jgi:hypothetical protein